MPDKYVIVGLGEALWDLLPEGKKLGGAPANFAFHAAALGDEGIIASRVGDDDLGREALEIISRLRLTDRYVQVDRDCPTGTVEVALDAHGQPNYTIIENVAWDWMEYGAKWRDLAKLADGVCFGSLAQRSCASRNTIRQFLRDTRPEVARIYDVNLRQSFYTPDIVAESLKFANIVKLNDAEIPVVIDLLGLKGEGIESGAKRLIDEFELDLVCVTRGANGSIIVAENRTVEHRGFSVEVCDAVGAGDAFTAALGYHYLRGSSLETISACANRYGSWVATQSGATPYPPDELLEEIR